MTKRSVLSLLAGVSMLFALLPFAAASAAPASDVFFSEYIEGSGYNKALEIYNGTNGTIDLSTYSIDLYSNANTSPNASVTLVGSVAAGDTFVIVLDDSRIDPALLALADQESNAINANGDDTYVLRNGSTNVDS
ncbi:MAG: lamin tail domain-containing protein, partial [Acidimicrobiia bacterium]|nr:lamin tail domain-containing protein [Acidimicrobiia bacterium]